MKQLKIMEDLIIEGVGVWKLKERCHICGSTSEYWCDICDELCCESCSYSGVIINLHK